jgi:hypothetical protein
MRKKKPDPTPEPAAEPPVWLPWATLEQISAELKRRELIDFMFAYVSGPDWIINNQTQKVSQLELVRMLQEYAHNILCNVLKADKK